MTALVDLPHRLEALAGEITTIAEITPERVLGLSADEVATIRADSDDPRAEALAVLDLVPGFARAFAGGNGRRIEGLQRDAARQRASGEERRSHLTTLLRDKRQAETTVLALQAVMTEHPDAVPALQRRCQQQQQIIASANEAADQTRQAILEALRSGQRLAAEAAALEAADGQISVATITRSVVEIMRIRRIPAVRQVRLLSEADHSGVIEVRLHPLVMHSPNDRANHLLTDLCFIIPLGATTPHELKWRGTGHPHAWEHGRICWGEADRPVAEALNRGDFASCVMFIVGWSRTYKPSYRRLEQYPVTDLEIGFHPELPVTGD
jgi:hypothetical protein